MPERVGNGFTAACSRRKWVGSPSSPLPRRLREAEQRAGVDQVAGRSYHGFNRTFATTHDEPIAASGQAGKRRDTMDKVYEGARPDEKAALAVRTDSMLKGAKLWTQPAHEPAHSP
jgi:hypothetical protein